MHALLSAAGRAFLRAFGAAIIVYSFGVLAAPNLNRAYDVGVAALAASVAAGIRALQAFVPQLTFAHYIGGLAGTLIDAFVHGLLGSMVITVPGALNAPHLSWERSTWVGLIVGAFTAGLRAVQAVTTVGEGPNPQSGITTPPGA